MQNYMNANRVLWNEITPLHARSAFYDVEGFKRGRNALMSIERDELGDVSGKSLLHLQCHFGMDTIRWARHGAAVTGVDFSPVAIDTARALAARMGVAATFVLSDVYDLPAALDGRFDVVFTSHGVLSWLPDLDGWARVVAHFLRPGGTFCLVEIHPFIGLFDEVEGRLELGGSLFDVGPHERQTTETYADGMALAPHPEHNWFWPVSSVVTALSGAGLRIERLRELPVDVRQRLPSMIRGEDGYWRLPGDPLPLLFTCVATRR